MKQNITLQTVIFAAVLVIAGFSQVSAQTLPSQPVAESQKLELRTSFRSRASNVNSPSLSGNQMQMMTHSSINSVLLAQSSQMASIATAALSSNKGMSLRDLENGGVRNFSAPLGSLNGELTNQHAVRVHVNFEVRPIGGVLTVRVDLVPQFSGVGVSNRPLASKTMMTAVDNLDASTVNALVASLSSELNDQIQHGNLN
jgi:hypothetical protein